jgi:electron transfer flavoprotein beta subunit
MFQGTFVFGVAIVKILVCVKQVPDSQAAIEIDEASRWVHVRGGTLPQMGRFDECAVEQALMCKEQIPGATVDAITVGSTATASVVRRAMGMGADHGIHVLTPEEGYVSALTTASRIAAAVRDRQYDLILAGVVSEDMGQGLVGPMLAELLSIPCATSCAVARVEPQRGCVYVERDVEGGLRQAIELDLPALVTVQSSMNRPRYPSLSNIMRANRYELEVFPCVASERPSATEDLVRLDYPQSTRSVVFLQGSGRDKARELLSIVRSRSLLRGG